MDEETLTALHESIAKWEAKAEQNWEDAKISAHDCPLCLLFHAQFTDGDYNKCCHGCPIAERTGEQYCRDTPYKRAANATSQLEWTRAARAEVAFLKSLLPGAES